MPVREPMIGPGCFQWNTGAWFGSLLGSTLWMLLGAAVLAFQVPWLAAGWAAFFLLANAIGIGLWRRRDRVPPFPAYMLLLLVVGVCGLLALVALDVFRPETVNLAGASPGEFHRSFVLLLVFVPGLMAFAAIQEWAGRKARSRRSVS